MQTASCSTATNRRGRTSKVTCRIRFRQPIPRWTRWTLNRNGAAWRTGLITRGTTVHTFKVRHVLRLPRGVYRLRIGDTRINRTIRIR